MIHGDVTAKREQYDSLVHNVLLSGFISTNEEQVQGTRGNAVQSSSPALSPAQVVPQHLVFCSFPARGCTLSLPNNGQMNHYPQRQQKKSTQGSEKGRVHPSFTVFTNMLGCTTGLHIKKISISINKTINISLVFCFQCEISTSHQKLNISS